MPSLAELQQDMRRALLEGEAGALEALVLPDGLSAGERLAVYRNNIVASLTGVLEDVFPAVRRLVDERFFAYAAHAVLTRQPPARACLTEYGEGFAPFLAAFPPARALVYLADVARLEWLMHRAATAAAASPLSLQALQPLAPEETPRLLLHLDASLGLIASPWPIDRIWRANRPGAESGETIDLDAGGVALEVRRKGSDVVMRALAPPEHAFRQALHGGATLAQAAEAALAEKSGFDLAAALAALFRDEAVVALALAPEESAA